jgi:Carboxypeptidase regulatory-like domain/Viral BACON domain/Putative binding domain, N-terminal
LLLRTFGRFAALLLWIAVAVSCSDKSSTAPTPPPPTPPTPARATIAVTSVSVVGERIGSAGAGQVYRVVLHLRESGGVAATIAAIDLTFTNGANIVMSSHHEQPIPATSNVCPANGTVDTRELITTDADATHPYATAVQARVTYTDATSIVGTANGSGDVPPLPPPPSPVTYTLTGIISDPARRGIENARVEILNGANGGKATTTDSAGAYTLTGLVAETFRMRASASGYDPGEQNVTVPDIPRADFTLRSNTPAACGYSVAPTGFLDVSQGGGQFSLTITRTSGTCGWQATTDVSWITLGASSGSGNTTMVVSYRTNTTFVGRIGTVTVEWAGGSAQLVVRQAPESPAFCRITVTVGGQSTITAPAAGGQFTASITPDPGVPPGACGAWTAFADPAMTIVGPNSGPQLPATVTFTVSPNPLTVVRSLFLTVNFGNGSPSGSLVVNQSGTP